MNISKMLSWLFRKNRTYRKLKNSKSTMFPQKWTRIKVIDKIMEVVINPIKIEKLSYGRLLLRGKTSCNKELVVILEPNGEVLTGHPDLKWLKGIQARGQQ